MDLDLHNSLRRVYGGSSEHLSTQVERYKRGLRIFRERYGPGKVSVFRASGRVNLIGEHTDYNYGFVLPMALDKDILVFARPRADQVVHLTNVEALFGDREFVISEDIPRRAVGDWANYVQGAAQLLEREYGPGLRGFDALVQGEAPYGVPRGVGLSSSSALTVASAAALLGINGVEVDGPAFAEACSRAEWYVGTRGGIMDHFTSVLARQGHALFLDCCPDAEGVYSYRHVSIPEGYAVVVVDSGVRHNNTGPHFNRRVVEGRIGVQFLKREYPEMTHLRDVQNLDWADIAPLLPWEIDRSALADMGIDPEKMLDSEVRLETDLFRVRKRCRHVITENERVLQSITALEDQKMERFGELLREAHASARDDYEISIPEIEVLVRMAESVPQTLGARLTGAGWGGCIVVLVERDGVDALCETIERGYREETGRQAKFFVCRSGAGAGGVLETSI
ncbi:MAG: galactokinase [Chloroflexota bacterium]|nr:galactokinase [Chloroflexota bacterium]